MNSRYRNLCFTLFDDTVLTSQLEVICDTVKFICFQYECCPDTHKVHVQGYVEFVNGASLATVKKLLGEGHYETRRGTAQQAYAYCSKPETSIPLSFFEFGSISNQGHRSDLDEDVQIIRNGGSLNDISPSNMIRYDNSFLRLQMRMIIPRTISPQLVSIAGKPDDILRYCFNTYSNLFIYKSDDTTDRSPSWNGYTGQQAILMYGCNSWSSFADFLHFISSHPYTLRILYNVIQLNSPIIIWYTTREFFIHDSPEKFDIYTYFTSFLNI